MYRYNLDMDLNLQINVCLVSQYKFRNYKKIITIQPSKKSSNTINFSTIRSIILNYLMVNGKRGSIKT